MGEWQRMKAQERNTEEQQTEANREDNLLELLEEEQFFMSKRQPLPKTFTSKARNSSNTNAHSSPTFHHARHHNIGADVTKTSDIFPDHQRTDTAGNLEGNKEEQENEDEFLVLIDEVESIVKAEERRSDQERALARRIKRATAEGSGANSVDGELTFNITYIAAFAQSDSSEYAALASAAEAQIADKLGSDDATVEVTKFSEGTGGDSTVMEVTMTVEEGEGRLEVAQALLDLWTMSTPWTLTYDNQTYVLVKEPEVETGGSNNAFEVVTCTVCTCLYTYKECKNSTSDPSVWHCLTKSEFYFAYGPNQGDSTLTKGRQRLSQRIKSNGGVPADERILTSLYINMHGCISVGRRHDSFTPLSSVPNNRFLLCAHWSHMQLPTADDRANIWYQVYQREQDDCDIGEQAQAMLDEGGERVKLYANLTTFTPTFMLVVTLEDVPPDGAEDSTTERVNCQMAVISNGKQAYGQFVYAQGGMLWTSGMNRVVKVTDGLTVLSIDQDQLDTTVGNTNNPGVWFWPLNDEEVDNAKQDCLNWFCTQYDKIDTFTEAMEDLPTCPCVLNVIEDNMAFQWEGVDYDLTCFRSSPNTAPSGTQYAKRCCYTESTGSFVTSFPEAGSFERYHPNLNSVGHSSYDEQPKEQCCDDSDLCEEFYTVRPRSTCEAQNITQSMGAGDPHFTTLDGKGFTFNAIGEYLFLELAEPPFVMQTRTQQAIDVDGNKVAASVFGAFAASADGVKFQAEMSNNRTGMFVFLEGQEISKLFEDNPSFVLRNGRWSVAIQQTTGTKTVRVSYVKDGKNVGFAISFHDRLLDIRFSLNFATSSMAAKGLLGNHNGDPEDDFIFPNGTTLPGDTSESDLFDYGKTWAITDSDSLFKYDPGFDTTYFTDENFNPVFLSEIPENELAVARDTCGLEDLNCIYDLVVTDDTELAVSTKTANTKLQKSIEAAANRAPTVTGPPSVQVTQGKAVNISFTAVDEDDDTMPVYHFQPEPASELTFSNETETATLNVNSSDVFNLVVAVKDSQNVLSPSLQVEVHFCTDCSGQGMCNFDNLETTENPYYKVATCDCEIYYSGADCSEDRNYCDDDPCPLSTTCTDLTVEQHKAVDSSQPGFSCSDCPQGYTQEIVDKSIKCKDINECGGNPCQHSCSNVQGSFLCSCDAGYRQLSSNFTLCADIDECQENTHDCQQQCLNLEGTFACSCFAGYSYNATTKTCVKDAVDPCENLDCEYACSNESGEFLCVCQSGYTLNTDQKTCKDLNECELNQCSQKCNNSVGSYACSCYLGYQLDSDKITCNPCPAFRFGKDCAGTCECRGRGTCDRVTGCVCQEGWRGSTCSEDVNECGEQANPCPFGQVCVNNDGSFACVCPDGFQKVNVTECVDINECKRASDNDCEQVCTNTQGSYQCSCASGYSYVPENNTCVDVNECETNTNNCEFGCENFPGSANCICGTGFTLKDDRRTCTKVLDPCERLAESISCDYACEVTAQDTAECYCSSGYLLASDGTSCSDINECENGQHQCDQTCQNSPGNYLCTCSTGYSLDNDKRTCVECDADHWGDNCANDCNCNPLGAARCDHETGCVCKAGWQGEKCQNDVNECSQDTSCQDITDSLCVNTAGSFLCQCGGGYQLNDGKDGCVDINECGVDQPNPCAQTCENNLGSFVCSCESGFNAVDLACVDVDECLTNPCDQLCRNTDGGFTCECEEGFLLNATTRVTCYVKSECGDNDCQHGCVLKGSDEECYCRAGYRTNSTNSDLCDDIDECDEGTPCINGTCKNLPGLFECSCENGTYLLPDKITCQVCPQGKRGVECSEDCTCDAANTESCDPVTGQCTCLGGWMGANCTTDVMECNVTDKCDMVPNSMCVDTPPGAYTCRCLVGFFTDFEGQCKACDDIHFGNECSEECDCVRANTADCNNTSGVCTCKAQWKGENCSQDVDECSPPLMDPCQTDRHETCRNTVGGHSCDCVSGYTRPSPDDDCLDLNECLLQAPCTGNGELCVNTNGSYNCVCARGYSNTTGNCSEDFTNYPVQLTFNMTFTLTLMNRTSSDYLTLQQQVGEFFNTSVGAVDDDAYHGTIITNITEGSVVVDVVIQLYPARTENPEGLVARATQDLLEAGDLELLGNNVTLVSAAFNGSTLCPQWKHGAECSEDCTCDAANTESCDPVTGQCTCLEGWTGGNCTTDVMECNVTPDICDVVPNSMCVDTPPGAYTCRCLVGFTDFEGQCKEDFTDYPVQLTFNMTFTLTLMNRTSSDYLTLQQQVGEFFNTSVGAVDEDAYHDTIITNITEGSVVVDAAIQLYPALTENPEGLVALATKDLLEAGDLELLGNNVSLVSAAFNGNMLSPTSTACEIFEAITPCNESHPCTVSSTSGLPECLEEKDDDDEDLSLVIGLAVGIPLAFITTVVIAVLIYLAVKRRNRHDSYDEGSDRSASIFATKLPTMGQWGMPRGGAMYAPDNRSVSMDSDPSEGRTLPSRGGKRGANGQGGGLRSDFQDSSWYDRYQPFVSATPDRTRQNAGRGHFSWEYIFQLMEPYSEDHPFSIQRPHVSMSPDPEQSTQSRRNGQD